MVVDVVGAPAGTPVVEVVAAVSVGGASEPGGEITIVMVMFTIKATAGGDVDVVGLFELLGPLEVVGPSAASGAPEPVDGAVGNSSIGALVEPGGPSGVGAVVVLPPATTTEEPSRMPVDASSDHASGLAARPRTIEFASSVVF